MPRGSAPGERRGGKSRGVPNKATLVKQLQRETVLEGLSAPGARKMIEGIAASVLIKAANPSRDARGTPQAITVLEQIMLLSMGFVAHYQPRDGNESANEAKMQEYLPFALGAAKELAKYQSPTFKAVAVADVTPVPAAQPGDGAKVIGTMGKRTQQDAANVYARLVRNDPKAA